MATIRLKLQSPTIELSVKARDASGNSEVFKMGFKRYDVEGTRKKFKELTDIQQRITEDSPSTEELDRFVLAEVVYVKGMAIDVEEAGIEKTINISDSRTSKPVETLWADGVECKDLLTSAALTSAPYRVAILEAMQKAFLNNDYSEAKVGN